MKKTGMTWAIVLAAGQGSRLQGLTRLSGRAVPKQFCSLLGGQSLFRDALERARRVVSADRVLTIVAAEQREFWQAEVTHLPADNVIVQPANRGTAAGILLPLLSILERDPDARIVVLPSDHFVAREQPLAGCLRRAARAVARGRRSIVLVGITPDSPEPSYGWILSRPLSHGLRSVTRFVEKPEPALARELQSEGGVWNSFLFAADGRALLAAFTSHLPELSAGFMAVLQSEASQRAQRLADLYATLDGKDFSRCLLENVARDLGLISAPSCGWTDLGTPERVRECLSSLRSSTPNRGLPPARSDPGWSANLANLCFIGARAEPLRSLRTAQ